MKLPVNDIQLNENITTLTWETAQLQLCSRELRRFFDSEKAFPALHKRSEASERRETLYSILLT